MSRTSFIERYVMPAALKIGGQACPVGTRRHYSQYAVYADWFVFPDIRLPADSRLR
jgi:hypothetical protein